MTVKNDIASFTPTATAQAAFASAGQSLSNLVAAAKQHAIELAALIKQISAFHPNGSVLTATVNAGGTGGTNGAVVVTGTTGAGQRFTAKGTIVSGALTGPLTIVNSGSYTTDPTSLTAEPVTGGNLTGATVGLTLSGDTANLSSLNSILAELA